MGFGHYIQNTGNQSVWAMEMFKSDRFEDVSLNQWMALTPHQLLQQNLNVGPELMNALRKEKQYIEQYPGFSYYPRTSR
jgi:oxalate decarboxylase